MNAYDMQILFTLGALPIAAYILLRRLRMRADRSGGVIGVVLGVLKGAVHLKAAGERHS